MYAFKHFLRTLLNNKIIFLYTLISVNISIISKKRGQISYLQIFNIFETLFPNMSSKSAKKFVKKFFLRMIFQKSDSITVWLLTYEKQFPPISRWRHYLSPSWHWLQSYRLRTKTSSVPVLRSLHLPDLQGLMWVSLNPLQPKRILGSSLEYALFYIILRFVQGTRGFGHVQLMNNTLFEML